MRMTETRKSNIRPLCLFALCLWGGFFREAGCIGWLLLVVLASSSFVEQERPYRFLPSYHTITYGLSSGVRLCCMSVCSSLPPSQKKQQPPMTKISNMTQT